MTIRLRIYYLLLVLLGVQALVSQSTSWKGTTSTSWTTASNWTNGVPTSTSDAVIGDANFTGANQPLLASTATVGSLTVGGTTASTLTINNKGTLTVNGAVTINANGTVNHNRRTLTVKGHWTNNGTYTPTSNSSPVVFAGTSQTIGGTPVSQSFEKVTINAGTTVTLAGNITTENTVTIDGTFAPSTFKVTNNGSVRFNSGSYLTVKASVLTGASGNFSATPTFSAGSTVEYSSSSSQSVTSATYSNLIISGSGTRTLAGNVTINTGNVTVQGGTLDLASFTLTRSAAGGVLTLSAGTVLRCANTTTPFPANFSTVTLNVSSTAEYYAAGAQTVSPRTYGNLKLSGSGTKSTAGTVTVSGNLVTAGTVTFAPGAAVTVSGADTIGSGTTFSGGSFTHTFAGPVVNNGTLNGGTGTITLSGNNTSVSGAGTFILNNLTVTGSGVTVNTATSVTIGGNLQTSGTGSFTHTSGGSGTITMNGTAKTISGTGIVLDDLNISAGSISAASSFTVAGNLTVNGTFSASSGTITLSGSGAAIAGSGAAAFHGLNVSGTLSTSRSFSIASNLTVSGSLTASVGTVTFNGTTALAGTADLFNVVLNGTTLQLGSGAILGVAGSLTLTSGSFDVTSTIPNTVVFNGSGAQSVTATSFHHLSLSNGGTKSAAAAVEINGDLTIGISTAFNAGSFSHTLGGNFTNNGTFNAGSSTVTFDGSDDAAITGTTTFNALTVSKSTAQASITLNNEVTVSDLTMSQGYLVTGSNAVTVTATRTGSGEIFGTITRTHAFANSTAYAFGGSFNTITFASGAGNISSVSVTISPDAVADFTFGSSVNREYTVSVTGSSYAAALRLQYDDAELNGNTENGLEIWRYGSSWSTQGKSSNDISSNWVELNGITDLSGRWTLSEFVKVVRWTGAVSSAWETAGNWQVITGSPALPPGTTDVVQLGDSLFTNQPTIASAVAVRSVRFGSAQGVTLTLASGSLSTTGNIDGTWSASRTHQISAGSAAIAVGGDLLLGDGTAGHRIDLSIGSGSVTVSRQLTQTSSSSVSFTGAGTLAIGGDYQYTSGTFTASTGTVTYNGTSSQSVASLTYRNLTINKSSGTAALTSSATVTNDLTVTAGVLSLSANLAVSGNITIASGATLNGGASTLSLGGNWSNSGTFIGGTGTVNLNGGGAQSIGAATFNNLTVNKGSGTAAPSANLTLNGNLTISAGTLDLSTFTANRSVAGGTLSISAGAALQLAGAGNFPANFNTISLASTSIVTYNGTIAQSVAAVSYGHLTISNGGSNAKTLSGNVSVAGALTVNSGATLSASSHTMTLAGGFTNSGTFTAGTGTVQMTGGSVSISGAVTFNHLTVTGTVSASDNISVNGALTNSGTFTTGATTLTLSGHTANTGTLTNSGSVIFSGATAQEIALNSGFTSTGTVLFNGTAAPVFSDGTTPSFSAVTINNTGGITPNIGWTVSGVMTISSGATFTGGSEVHLFNSTFTNNGTVSSSGTLKFSPSSAVTLTLPGTSFNSSGTVEFAGSGAITLSSGSPTLSSVTVSNTNGAGVTLVSGWTLSGDLVVQSGATLHAGTGLSHTLAGNFTANGTFSGGTSTVTFNNSGNRNISAGGSTTFHHLTIASADSITVVSNINISGSLTNNGTLVNDGVVITMNGSSDASISGSATAFDQLTVNKSSATVTLGVAISNLSDLTVSAGTLDLASFTATDNSTDGGSLTLAGGAAMKIGGTSPTSFDAFSFASTSTVTYTGTGQTINSVPGYGHLTIAASGSTTLSNTAYSIAGDLTLSSGTVTAGNSTTLSISGNYAQTGGTFTGGTGTAFTIAGNFSLSSGTFAPSSGAATHSVGGNWTMSGGSFTNTNTTVRFNGTGAQSVSSTGTFNSMTVNKSAGTVSLSSNITVSATLTLTSGNIVTNGFTLIIPSAGTVSRTSGHIVGSLQKNVATGSPVRTFEIGDATAYTPVSLTFASVSVAGNLVVSTASGDHSDVLNSGINPNKSVNRTWSMTGSGITFTSFSTVFTFVAGDIDAGAATSSFNVSKRTSGSWAVQTVGTRTAKSTQATSISAFGEFQIGESGKVWNGSVDNNWNTAANWTPSGVPSALDAVTIGTAGTVNVNTTATTADLTVGNASLQVNILSGQSVTVSGNLTVTSGTLSTAAAFPSVSGTTTLSGGTVAYTGTAAQSIAEARYVNLTISGARTTNSVTFPTDTVHISGVFTASATFTTGAYITTGSTIEYNGTGSQTVSPLNYHNLLISGTRSDSVKIDSASVITITGSFTSSAAFSSGTLSFKGSTVNFNGSGAQTIPAFNYDHVTVSGARGGNTVTFSSADTIGISGTFTPSATSVSYSQTGAVFEFNGASAQTIPAFTYNAAVFSGAGAKNISSALTVSNDATNRAGTTVNIGAITVQVLGTLNNAGTMINDGTVQTGD